MRGSKQCTVVKKRRGRRIKRRVKGRRKGGRKRGRGGASEWSEVETARTREGNM
jgi:hypothetical protein